MIPKETEDINITPKSLLEINVFNITQELEKIWLENNLKIVDYPKGTMILEEGQENNDLYYVLNGELEGITKIKEASLPLYKVSSHFFIGLFSAFEKANCSISSVRSKTPVKIVIISENDHMILSEKYPRYEKLLFSLIIHQFRSRMKKFVDLRRESFESQEKLILQEKMATVGRMSASLAHELNNNIAVISKGLEFLFNELPLFLEGKLSNAEYNVFIDALSNGTQKSFKSIRNESEALSKEKKYGELGRRKIASLLEIQNENENITLDELAKLSGEELKELRFLFNAGSKFQALNNAGKQIVHVVQNFKTLSKPPSTMELYPVEDTIKHTLQLLTARLEGVAVCLELEFNGSIECRPEDLIQLWSNLISNAIDAMEGYGNIIINTSRMGESVLVEIKDSGHGISIDVAEEIFQPHITTKRGNDGASLGLGLGLTICKQIVETHRGRIEAVSDPNGAIFRVILPIRRKT